MSKLLLIAAREYAYNFKRPRYLMSAFGVPVLLFAVYFIIFSLIAESAEGSFGTIGYVDHSGVLQDIAPPDGFGPVTDEETARERLLDGELDAYIVINENYLNSGQIDFYSTRAASLDISERVGELMEEGLVSMAQTAYPVERLRDPINLKLYDFEGNLLGDSEEDLLPRFAVPFAFIMVMYIATNTTASFLLSSIVEEKENRMMELLVTSCTPTQLMWGK
ncbi:MAG: ABC transporter permease, partial [Chloroflexi bacterium]|nr:ABC transporter permease [Chloroflexota bacterium]